jgi:HEAT repeat protein
MHRQERWFLSFALIWVFGMGVWEGKGQAWAQGGRGDGEKPITKRLEAVAAMAARGQAADIAGLQASLEDASPIVRSEAALALGRFPSSGEASVAALVKSMEKHNDDAALWASALQSLGHLGDPSIKALPAIRAAMWKGKKGPIVLFQALWVLRKLAPKHGARFVEDEIVQSALLAATRVRFRPMRENALALFFALPVVPKLFPIWQRLLLRGKPALAQQAEEALSKQTNQAAFLIPRLRGLLALAKDKQRILRILVALGDKEASSYKPPPALRDYKRTFVAAPSAALLEKTKEKVAALSKLPKGSEREAAIAALVKEGGSLLPALAALLTDPQLAIRKEAVGLLGALGEVAAPAVDALLEHADVNDPAMAWHIKESYKQKIRVTLKKIGKKAIPALAAGLVSEKKEQHKMAALALVEMAPLSLPLLRRLLASSDVRERLGASALLRSMSGEHLVGLLDEVKRSYESLGEIPFSRKHRWSVGFGYQIAFANIGEKAAPLLLGYVRGEDYRRVQLGEQALRQMGGKAAVLHPELLAMLERGEKVASAASILESTGKPFPTALPTLKRLFFLEKNPQIQGHLAQAYVVCGGREAAMMRQIGERAISALEETKSFFRVQPLLIALERAGKEAKPALPSVMHLLQRANLRESELQTPINLLTKMEVGAEAASLAPRLLAIYEGARSDFLKQKVLRLLSRLGEEGAKLALPRLLALTQKASSWQAGDAFKTLLAMGEYAHPVVPAMWERLAKEPSFFTRRDIRKLLKKTWRKHPALVEQHASVKNLWLLEGAWGVMLLDEEAFSRFLPTIKASLPALSQRAALGGRDLLLLRQTLRSIGSFGAKAASLSEALATIQREATSAILRREAQIALAKIQPPAPRPRIFDDTAPTTPRK